MSCVADHNSVNGNAVMFRYLVQRKENGNDGSTFTYEAGPNVVDELKNQGGIDSYLDQVRMSRIVYIDVAASFW